MSSEKFIGVYNNVFDSAFCQSIIEQTESIFNLGYGHNRQVNTDIKKINIEDKAFYLPSDQNLLSFDTDSQSQIIEKLWQVCFKKYSDKYAILANMDPISIYVLKVQRTKPTEGYHTWHFEAGNRATSNRVLAFSVYLNDNFDAGETEFLYQQYRYTPKQGDVLIFPASFTHTHRGNPPMNGTKYIITGWIEF